MIELMENVEILSREEIIESIPPLYGLLSPILLIITFFGVILCLWAFAKLSCETHDTSLLFFGVAFSIALGLIGLVVSERIIVPKFTEEVPTGRYKYEVLVKDDSVVKEIYDNYEIIEVNGIIYTIQDKPIDSEERR